jgi:hypothetical protein
MLRGEIEGYPFPDTFGSTGDECDSFVHDRVPL